uniref:Uncharacterized protein n=1 Tax=Setaria italica TaxID=4555 RepID=K4A0C2_SETIT
MLLLPSRLGCHGLSYLKTANTHSAGLLLRRGLAAFAAGEAVLDAQPWRASRQGPLPATAQRRRGAELLKIRPYISLDKYTVEDPDISEPIPEEKLTCDLSGLMSSLKA